MPSLSLTGIHASGGTITGRCGLVPTLATDTGRGGNAGSGVGTGTGCEIFCEGSSGDGMRTGVVTVMGFNGPPSGGSVNPGALPPPPP
jgi:hypothetical protein